ncbi:MAG: metal ABC transporter substrate-binding protein [Candidatus Odinarchaeota archaeon]
MKKTYLLISILIVFGIIAQNITVKAENNLKSSADPEVQVVATTTILRDFAQKIIGDKGTVEVIIEEGMCPGHYDATPSDINLVRNADIVFYHGFEWAQFLGALLSDADNIDAAYSMSGNGSLGYTQWGAPANVPPFLDVICNHLNDTYSLLNETFNQNTLLYKEEIALKKNEIENEIVSYNFTDIKAYIMNHQTAFMTWLGFNITGLWSKDDNSMTPSDLDTIIDGASETGTEIIIMNYQSGTEQGKLAADYLNIPSVSLQNFPGVYGIETYLEQLDFNVAMLNWALNDGPDPRNSTDSIGLDLMIPLGVFISLGVIFVIYRKKLILKN